MSQQAEAIRCAECSKPVFVVLGSTILIESRHNGQHHSTFLSALDLRKILDKLEKPLLM